MKPDWTPLTTELALWAHEGMTLPLWWRDDDAIASTLPLERLLKLSDTCRMPVHLAVIPAKVQPSLADIVRSTPNLTVLVHGWAHENHAPKGKKKCEFGSGRSLQKRKDDANRGLNTLSQMFGPSLAAMFVPPWNRIAPDLVTELTDIGFVALSTFTPRGTAFAAPGLAQINTHLDPIDWKGSRSLAQPDVLIAQLCNQLAARRMGIADNDEPYGVLTHHLVHDAAIWNFTEQMLLHLMDGPVSCWNASHLNRLEENAK